MDVKGRDAELKVGLVHSVEVSVYSKHYNSAIISSISLAALEALNRVV